MNFWQYISAPTGASLGPIALQMIFLSVFLAIGGIALMILPKELMKASLFQSVRAKSKERGLEEQKLRTEMRMKMSMGLVAWSGALILALLLRLLGTPDLTHVLPAIVLLIFPLLVGYILVYRLFFFPRYLEVSHRIDTRKSYEPKAKKSRKALARESGKEKVNLMPTKATIGLFTAPIIYYVIMIGVSIPPGSSSQQHDHALHQFGMPILGLLGYLIGLMWSLGDDIRVLVPWSQPSRR